MNRLKLVRSSLHIPFLLESCGMEDCGGGRGRDLSSSNLTRWRNRVSHVFLAGKFTNISQVNILHKILFHVW